MTFELEADGVRVWCSSPEWTRKLVEKGARLVDPNQAAYLNPVDEPSPRLDRRRARKRPTRSEPGA